MMVSPLAEPSPRRWAVTFAVVAALLIVFSLVAFWGLAQSDWLYGTYGQISQAQWEQMAELRERLVQLDLAPEAVSALDDALLLPHPSTEQVLSDLKKAVQVLDQFHSSDTARQIQFELQTLIATIEPAGEPERSWPTFTPPWPTVTPRPIPTLTPIRNAPIAHDHDGLSALPPLP
jgi:hypothetical protein